jgi:hypothetical protein
MRFQCVSSCVGVVCITLAMCPENLAQATPLPQICSHAAVVPIGTLNCMLSSTGNSCIAANTVNVKTCSGGNNNYKCGSSTGNGVNVQDGTKKGVCISVIDPLVCSSGPVKALTYSRAKAKCSAPTGGNCPGCTLTPLTNGMTTCADCQP